MRINCSMRNKLILALFIGCVIPYFLGGWYLKAFVEEWLYKNSIEKTNQVLLEVKELIDKSLITGMKEEVTLLASLDEIKGANRSLPRYFTFDTAFQNEKGSTEKELHRIFRAEKDSHRDMNYIFLGAEDGGYMEYPDATPTRSYDPRIRQWYKDTIGQDQVVISKPYITGITGDPVISFTKRIKDGDRLVGVVGVSVNLKELTSNINQVKLGQSGCIMVLSSDHKFLVSPGRPEWIMKSPDELGLSAFQFVGTKDLTPFEAKIEKENCIFNSVISQESGLRIISVVPKQEILLMVKEFTNILISIYIVTLLVIFFIV